MKKIQSLCIYLILISPGVSAESIWDKPTQNSDKTLEIVVYRSPTCGCCSKWIKHLKAHQFNVTDIVTEDVKTVKAKHGIPENMASCHTAIIDGYAIEGHVPAFDIKALLAKKSKVVGLAVPGMVTGSPGMEMGGKKDPFNVWSFGGEEGGLVFKSYSDY